MASEWRKNIYATGNIGWYIGTLFPRRYHIELVAELDPPLFVGVELVTHLLRYKYPAGRVTMWGRPVFGGYVAPWGFFPLPNQNGPFPHGYNVVPDTGA